MIISLDSFLIKNSNDEISLSHSEHLNEDFSSNIFFKSLILLLSKFPSSKYFDFIFMSQSSYIIFIYGNFNDLISRKMLETSNRISFDSSFSSSIPI